MITPPIGFSFMRCVSLRRTFRTGRFAQGMTKARFRVFLPQAKPSEKCVSVVAQTGIGRQLFDFMDISSTQHHVVSFQSFLELFHDVGHVTPPSLFTETCETVNPNVILVSPPFLVGKVRQLHGFDDAIHNHGRAETSAQTKKKHPPPFVTSERLHSSVVDNLDGAAERLDEVESYPAPAEIVRLVQRASVDHGSRIANRDHIVFPALYNLRHIPHHCARGHGWAGGNLALLALSGCQNLDVRSPNVKHQDFGSSPFSDRVHALFSKWPPNSNRMAESNLSAKSASPREVNLS